MDRRLVTENKTLSKCVLNKRKLSIAVKFVMLKKKKHHTE